MKPKLVRITADEALSLQWKTINEWEPSIDVWPFKYGVGMLAAAAAFSGAFFNAHYRKVAKVRHYGQLATLLPAILIPSLSTALIHSNFVSSQILVGPACLACIEVRAVSIQLMFGIVFPLVVTPFGVFSIAARQYTYPVPPIWPLTYFVKVWWKMTSPKLKSIGVIAASSSLAAILVTQAQYSSLAKVNRKLDQMMDEQLRSN